MHFKTFLNGVAVGILLGVLFAPDSGEETRRKISRRAAGLKDKYDDLAQDVSYTFNKAKKKINNFADKTASENYDYLKDEADII